MDGYSRDYYPKAVREAERVADRLSAAVGATVAVRPVLVVTGVDRRNIRVKAEPADVAVVARRQLLAWLQHQPQILPAQAVQLMANKARHPSTWDPSKVAEVLDVASPPRPADQPAPTIEVPAVPEPPGMPVAAAQAMEPPPGVTVVRWRRYGHDRLYVNDAAGVRLGWRDNTTGEVHVEDDTDATVVEAALTDWDRDGQGS